MHDLGPPQDGDIGWSPGGAGLAWGAAGGALANVLTGFALHATGSIALPAQLVGSSSAAVGWIVHVLAGAVFGLAYGAFVRTRDLVHGLAWGAFYGALVGVVFVWIALNLLVGRPVAFDASGGLQVLMHVVWGAMLGVVTAWGLRHRAEAPAIAAGGA